MRRRVATRAAACVGAVVGAGFASGREIITFFTGHGALSWSLIVLSAAAMCLFYTLLSKYPPGELACQPTLAAVYRGFRVLLFAVTGGAMVGACGEVAALLLPIGPAYALGAVVCVLAAYWLSGRSLRPLAGLSWGLLALLCVALVLLLAFAKEEPGAVLYAPVERTLGGVLRAAGFAVSYACLNVSLSMGVICEGEPCDRSKLRSGVLFGWAMAVLMFVSNALYLRHPSALNATLPIVWLLSGFGRAGFWASALLLLLALMTSLIGVLRGLRCELLTPGAPRWRRALVVLLPLGISAVGFSQIVSGVYPYLGLVCVGLIYVPMMWRKRRAAPPRGRG